MIIVDSSKPEPAPVSRPQGRATKPTPELSAPGWAYRMRREMVAIEPIVRSTWESEQGTDQTVEEEILGCGLYLPDVRNLKSSRDVYGIVRAFGPGGCDGACLEQEPGGYLRVGDRVLVAQEDVSFGTMVDGRPVFLLPGEALRAVIHPENEPDQVLRPLGQFFLSKANVSRARRLSFGPDIPEDHEIILPDEVLKTNDIRKRKLKLTAEELVARGDGARRTTIRTAAPHAFHCAVCRTELEVPRSYTEVTQLVRVEAKPGDMIGFEPTISLRIRIKGNTYTLCPATRSPQWWAAEEPPAR